MQEEEGEERLRVIKRRESPRVKKRNTEITLMKRRRGRREEGRDYKSLEGEEEEDGK